MAIAEYLLLTSATAEIDNRKYCRKEFWDALAKTTVDLKPPVTDATKRKDDNLGVDKVAADLYNTVSGAGEDMGPATRNDSGNDCDVELPSGFYGTQPDDDDEGDRGAENDQNVGGGNRNDNAADRNEVEIRIGRSKKAERVRRMAVNELCFKDIIGIGTKKLEAKNLATVRHRKFQRQERKRNIDNDVYEEYKRYCENGVEDGDTRFEMSKLKRRNPNLV